METSGDKECKHIGCWASNKTNKTHSLQPKKRLDRAQAQVQGSGHAQDNQHDDNHAKNGVKTVELGTRPFGATEETETCNENDKNK